MSEPCVEAFLAFIKLKQLRACFTLEFRPGPLFAQSLVELVGDYAEVFQQHRIAALGNGAVLLIAERKGLWYKIYSPYQEVDLDERIKLNKGMKVKLHLIAFYPPDHANFLHFIYFYSPFDGTNQKIYCDYKTGQKIYESPDIKSNFINRVNVMKY